MTSAWRRRSPIAAAIAALAIYACLSVFIIAEIRSDLLLLAYAVQCVAVLGLGALLVGQLAALWRTQARLAAVSALLQDTQASLGTSNSALRLTKDELKRARRQLVDGIEGLADGFALYDAADRLVICNRRYRELYGSEFHAPQPGTRFEDMLRNHVMAGRVPSAVGHEEEWIAERLAQHRDPHGLFERNICGRWYRFSDRPTSEGGTVTIFTPIDELKQREQRLRESQTILQSILDHIPVTVSIADGERRIVLMNKRLEALYGVKLSDVVGRNLADVRPSRYRSDGANDDHFRVVETGERIVAREEHYVHADGEETWITSVVPIKDEQGTVQYVLRTTMEVPQLARANRELADYRAFLIEAERQARMASWFQDVGRDDEVVWSENALDVLGLPPERLDRDQDLLSLIHLDDRERMAVLFREITQRPDSYDTEFRIVRPDGSVAWIRGLAKVQRDADGHPERLVGSVQDITSQKRIEHALRESEARLKEAHRRARLAYWIWNLDTQQITVGEDYAAVLGIPMDALPATDTEHLKLVHPEDRGRVAHAYERAVAGLVPYALEYRVFRADGSIGWLRELGELQSGAGVGRRRFAGTMQDITEQKTVEEALRASDARMRAFMDHAPMLMYLKDADARYQLVNREFEKLENVSAESIRGKTVFDVLPLEQAEAVAAADREILAGGRVIVREICYPERGAYRDTLAVKFPVRDRDGAIIGIGGFTQDVTERKRAEAARQQTESLLRAFMHNAPAAMAMKDSERRFVMLNSWIESAYGRPAEELIGRRSVEILPSEGTSVLDAMESEVVATGQTVTREVYFPERKTLPWTYEVKFPIRDGAGATAAIGGIAIDISDRKRAELALRDSESRLRRAQQQAKLAYWSWQLEADEYLWAPGSGRILGVPDADMPRYEAGFYDRIHPDDRDRMRRVYGEVLAGRDEYTAEFRIVRPNGQVAWVEEFGEVERDDDGRRVAVAGIIQDISDRKQAEAALRDSEARLRRAQQQARLAYWSWQFAADPAAEEFRWSPGSGPLLGVTDEEMPGNEDAAKAFMYPDDVVRVRSLYREVRDGLDQYDLEYRVVHPDGQVVWVREIGEVVRDAEGRRVGVEGTLQDITDRRALEERLVQSQKMEAIGQLTGGIAHDFNNLLAVILGNLELLGEELPGHAGARQKIEAALRSTLRGSDLTHRLLAYARRQPLAPKRTQVNEMIRQLRDLMLRPLGPTIDVTFALGEGLWPTEIDQTQLETSLLNLVINARDAMPDGGRLVIETANASIGADDAGYGDSLGPGDYVCIVVRDSGVGMSDTVRARAFDPFFTTKGVGKGTGLGLSMVYGFVKQSGGHIEIDSAVGGGTTIRIYLPRAKNGAGFPAAPRSEVERSSRTVATLDPR